MDLFAVTGRPILHSKSPSIYNACFRERSVSARYSRLAADSAGEAMDLFLDIGLKGMNVTAPFKAEIIPCLQHLDAAAERIGSVNTIVREGTILKGYNTDYLGVSGALESRGIDPRGKPCLVLGAGGAGRAAVFALIQKGGLVTILNRNPEKARLAAETIGGAAGSLRDLDVHVGNARILVLTIPCDESILKASHLSPGQVLLVADYKDTTYEPIAARKGLRHIRGEEWLKHQAIPALRLFLGDEGAGCNIDWPRVLQAAPPASRENIALIGFMGSGKSAVARGVAARLDYDFVDIDDWIEKKAGKPIRDIFETDGEVHFRRMEKDALAEFAPGKRSVLACGGGAVLDEDNRRRLAENSLVIWIYTSMETAFSRMDISRRPLLRHPRPFFQAQELFAQRRTHYFECADLVIGNEGPLEKTIGKIHEEIRLSL